MKKTTLTLLFTLLLLSCNKDDDGGEKSLPVTVQNLEGIWYYDTVIRTNGSIAYPHSCTTQRDYAEFFQIGKIITHDYYATCDNFANYGCPDFILVNSRITACQEHFDNALVTRLTTQTLEVRFDEPRYMPEMSPDNTQVTGIILKRQ
jgi:hypothetical protein